MDNNCEKCCHKRLCNYLSGELYGLNPEEEFQESCAGCCCGDGMVCNLGSGCLNFETEPILG